MQRDLLVSDVFTAPVPVCVCVCARVRVRMCVSNYRKRDQMWWKLKFLVPE